MKPLSGQVALVAGATRGCGRGIAVELGAMGATVYCTGRTTREQASPMNRPETIDETAELVTAAGGKGIAVRVDHTDIAQVDALMARIEAEQGGRLDILVNDIWGGEELTQWKRFWEQDTARGLTLIQQAVFTHIITARAAVPLLMRREKAILFEITDGNEPYYRGDFFYDFVKVSLMRMAVAFAEEFKDRGITALAITPGFLRSEWMLDHFGVREENWRDAVAQDAHYAWSETPRFLGRCIAALAADPAIRDRAGKTLASWDLAEEYGLWDVDGTRPHWTKNTRLIRLESEGCHDGLY